MLKTYTVCVNGMGSSLILRMTVERALSELGIEAEVEAIDLGSLAGKRAAGLIVTTPMIAKGMEIKPGTAVATITNFTDIAAAKESIKKALELV